jgi:hypothetical protein
MSDPNQNVSVQDIKEEKASHTIDIDEDNAPSTPDLKVHHDGSTILVPQPTSDPNDPLNWSWMKKHLFLMIISIIAFLPDYGSSTGAITNLVQPSYVS